MAVIRNNVLMEGVSGMIGKALVFRKFADKTVVQAAPVRKAPYTTKQQLQQNRFREAMAYARRVLADAAVKERYTQLARQHSNMTAFNLVIREFLNRKSPICTGKVNKPAVSRPDSSYLAVSANRIMTQHNDKPEIWETSFIEKQEMWGFEPAHSAVSAKDLFAGRSVQHVLIPGIGYGRNAKVFTDHGMKVTGIEISSTAIKMARKHYGSDMPIYHGSVTDMPFDDLLYGGIFCYALIHLLDTDERAKLISDCYNQLEEGGCMVFTAITKEAATYGKGTFISTDRYEIFEGIRMFFYDRESISREFGPYGLQEASEIPESQPFYFITCIKEKQG
jgi:SAM-dependent methyltransferase